MFSSFMIAHPAEGMINKTLQLVGCAINCLADSRSLIGNGNRLATFDPRFHHASFIVRASALFAVFIAEMDLDAGNMLRDVVQGSFHHPFGMPDHLLVASNVMIRIDLNFHKILLFLTMKYITVNTAPFSSILK